MMSKDEEEGFLVGKGGVCNPIADDDVDSDYDDDVCQSNIYRECVSSLPRRRHQTACGYTLELSNIIISIVITIIRNYDNLIIIIIIMIIRRPVLKNHLLTDWFVRIQKSNQSNFPSSRSH